MSALATLTLIKDSITAFEDLSNELIYEIFEFLNFHHTFGAFYDLNERFQSLFVNSNFSIKVNISSKSKSLFQRYLTHIIIPHTYRIKSLRLWNPFASDMSLLLFPIMTNLTRLGTLVINNIESDYIEGVVNNLSSLPVLSSLIIISVGFTKNPSDVYQKIFRLPALKYCQILFGRLGNLEPLSIATNNEFSPIEHLVINNYIFLDQPDSWLSLLSYAPQLRRLSLGYLCGPRFSRTHMSSIVLNYLTHISLQLYSSNFDNFELLFTDFFHQVQFLRITIGSYRFHVSDTIYLNADRWERLISTQMPNLCVFDFQHQHYQTDRLNCAIFYSIDPYRRKYFMLYEELNKKVCSYRFKTNEDPVHHVHIHNTNATTRFVGDFPNATELTLSETFDMPLDSIVTSLNRIIPLRQLSKLVRDCHHFPFDQVIELLHFTPNVHTLTFDSILFYRTDSVSIQQNEIFRIVSNANIITIVTIRKESTLEKIQLLIALFPRLEYLTINLFKEDLESIARFLLSKPNNNTQYLSPLCFKATYKFAGNIENFD